MLRPEHRDQSIAPVHPSRARDGEKSEEGETLRLRQQRLSARSCRRQLHVAQHAQRDRRHTLRRRLHLADADPHRPVAPSGREGEGSSRARRTHGERWRHARRNGAGPRAAHHPSMRLPLLVLVLQTASPTTDVAFRAVPRPRWAYVSAYVTLPTERTRRRIKVVTPV